MDGVKTKPLTMYLSMKGTWKDIGTFYTKLTYSKLFRHFHVSTFYPTYHFGPMKMLKYWHKINKRLYLKKKKKIDTIWVQKMGP